MWYLPTPVARNRQTASHDLSSLRRTNPLRTQRPPSQPSGFISPRKHLCNHLQGLALSGDPHPFPGPFLPCRLAPHSGDAYDFGGFPLRKGARLDRSPAEPVPSWRFPPLRLSLSSRWTRLPGSSSHVLGGLPAEASCGRNPRPPAPQSLTQRRTRLRAPRPKAGRLSSFPNRTSHPKVLAPFRSREDLHSPEGEWTVPAPLGSATCSPTSAASSVAEGDGSRSRRR